MEKRVAKVNFSSAGGTASKGAKTCKITLPTTWMNKLGINEKQREVELAFDGKQIILSRIMTGEEFAVWKIGQGHDVRLFRFYDGDKLCTKIHADFTDKTLTVENKTNNPVKTAFGNNALPTWADFRAFLEERCVPRQRACLREYLEAVGVSEYDPIAIIQKTAGRMAEDNQWLEMEVLT